MFKPGSRLSSRNIFDTYRGSSTSAPRGLWIWCWQAYSMSITHTWYNLIAANDLVNSLFKSSWFDILPLFHQCQSALLADVRRGRNGRRCHTHTSITEDWFRTSIRSTRTSWPSKWATRTSETQRRWDAVWSKSLAVRALGPLLLRMEEKEMLTALLNEYNPRVVQPNHSEQFAEKQARMMRTIDWFSNCSPGTGLFNIQKWVAGPGEGWEFQPPHPRTNFGGQISTQFIRLAV